MAHKFQILAPDSNKSDYPNFYVVSKVHKSALAACSIIGAYNSLTSHASKIVSNVLGFLFKKVQKQAVEFEFESILAVCINTNDTIYRAQKAFNSFYRVKVDTDTASLAFTFFDFKGIYNNLNM